jgi:hypothetical protein
VFAITKQPKSGASICSSAEAAAAVTYDSDPVQHMLGLIIKHYA